MVFVSFNSNTLVLLMEQKLLILPVHMSLTPWMICVATTFVFFRPLFVFSFLFHHFAIIIFRLPHWSSSENLVEKSAAKRLVFNLQTEKILENFKQSYTRSYSFKSCWFDRYRNIQWWDLSWENILLSQASDSIW